MTLEPILDSPWLVKLHLLGAGSAFVLAPVQAVLPARSGSRRMLGWALAGLLALATGAAVFLSPAIGPDYARLGPARLAVLMVGVVLPFAIWAARPRLVRRPQAGL